jgi:CHASE2 domain-containing sensor protein
MARRFDTPKAPNSVAALFWLALVILGVGGVVIYFLLQDQTDPDTRRRALLTGMCAIVGAGICLIAASSRWWMKR